MHTHIHAHMHIYIYTYLIFDAYVNRWYDKAVHHKRALRSPSKGKRMIATPRRLSGSPAFQNHKYSHELTANCQWWAYIKDLDDAVRRAAPGHVIILPSHTGWMSLFPLRTYTILYVARDAQLNLFVPIYFLPVLVTIVRSIVDDTSL